MCLCTGKAIAGTTDSPIELTHLPTPKEEDIRFILEEIKHYLSPDISGSSMSVTSFYAFNLFGVSC